MHVLLFLTLLASQGQGGVTFQPQGQPRDPTAKPAVGTGTISGKVTASDTGAPFRRAQVTLGGSRQPRMAYTDTEGRYSFKGLPPGTYQVMVVPGNHRAGYLSGAYGTSLINTPYPSTMRPKGIELADGQHIENVNVSLIRGGAISGTITDASGEPASRVQVAALLVRRGSEPGMVGGSASSDDLGQFRLFGLPPGEYVVFASPQGSGFGGPYEVQGEATGFTTTFAPGAGSLSDAARVRVPRGGQASIDIRLIETRVYTIRGMVVSSAGEPLKNASITLSRADTMLPMIGGGYGSSIMPDGTFAIRNVAPGQYELIARYTPPQEGPTPNPQLIDRTEMATMRIDVGAADIDGLTLVTQRGATVVGQIAFEDGHTEGRRVQINAQPTERRMYGPGPAVDVKESTFTIRNLFGAVVIRGSAFPTARPVEGSNESFGLKAVLLNGRDITDEPRVLTNADSGKLQVVFTTHAPGLEGTVTDDAGKLVQEYTVLLFGEDAATWQPNSSMMRVSRPMKEGKFQFRGLREGRYRAVALPPDVALNWMRPDPQLLEALSKVATPVLLNAGEMRTLDLKLTPFEQ